MKRLGQDVELDLTGVVPAEAMAAWQRHRPGTVCRVCGIGKAKTKIDTLCLACAKKACARSRDDSWFTTSEGSYAVARRKESSIESCESCYGTGSITFEVARPDLTNLFQYSMCEPCPGAGLDDKLAFFSAARCPAYLHGATFKGYEIASSTQGDALERVSEMAASVEAGDRGIMLAGSPGTGKTHLLVAMIKKMTIGRGKPCRYMDIGDLVKMAKQGFESHTTEKLMEPLERVPFLFIDELGKGDGKEWRQDLLEGLLDRRYRNCCLTTCFASNLSGDELGKKVGDRVMSRLKEMAATCNIIAPDYRERGQRRK